MTRLLVAEGVSPGLLIGGVFLGVLFGCRSTSLQSSDGWRTTYLLAQLELPGNGHGSLAAITAS